VECFGQLDIVVNNSGEAIFKPLTDVTEKDFDSIFALNTRGTFFAMQEAARRVRDGGHIINISTAGTRRASPSSSVYGGSKAAVKYFARVLAKEVGSRQITVNVVSPGPTETEMLSANPQFRTIGLQLSPLERLGKPDDIASVVAFLASHEVGWITGQVIQASGGISSQRRDFNPIAIRSRKQTVR
jgi:3-oxoacyl-[acyl-carrier protein] reductase